MHPATLFASTRLAAFSVSMIARAHTQQVQINEDFCGMDVNQPLGGTIPIESEPSIVYNDVQLTSVVATSTYDYTVVFLGTVTGHLKKVSLEALYLCWHFIIHNKIKEARQANDVTL